MLGRCTTDFQKALNSVKGNCARFHPYRLLCSVLAFIPAHRTVASVTVQQASGAKQVPSDKVAP